MASKDGYWDYLAEADVVHSTHQFSVDLPLTRSRLASGGTWPKVDQLNGGNLSPPRSKFGTKGRWSVHNLCLDEENKFCKGKHTCSAAVEQVCDFCCSGRCKLYIDAPVDGSSVSPGFFRPFFNLPCFNSSLLFPMSIL